jgi:hypothetical protein
MGEYASRSIYLELAKREEGTKMAPAEVKLAEICLKFITLAHFHHEVSAKS